VREKHHGRRAGTVGCMDYVDFMDLVERTDRRAVRDFMQ